MTTKLIMQTAKCPKHKIAMRFEFCQECSGGATFGRYCQTCRGEGGFWICSRCDQERIKSQGNPPAK